MNGDVGLQALQALSTRYGRLNEGIRQLEQLNVSTTLSSMPKYAMIGDQSAGKSSLVQAICGIPLPRSDGTTTRCPYYIITTRGTPPTGSWICHVSFRLQYDYHDGDGTWHFNERSKAEAFTAVQDLSELGLALRRVQIALLNPKDDPQQYLSVNPDEHLTTQVLFSPNLVCLNYQAPDIPELAFYDLPGCINVYDMPKTENGTPEQSQQSEKDLIEMITATVLSYIKDERCLTLVACSATQDLETCLTMRLVKESGATQRCIGVLTKADLVAPSAMKAIREVLGGGKHPFGKGWYTVARPSQQDLDAGMDDKLAAKREKDLFATSQWADTPNLRSRYGTTRLRENIADNLAEIIVSELPKMAELVESRIVGVDKELDRFPEPPKEPNHVVLTLIDQVSMCLMKNINADFDDNLFRMEFDRHLKSFAEQLQTSKLKVEMEKQPEDSISSDTHDNVDISETATLQNKRNCKPITRSFESDRLDFSMTKMCDRLEHMAIRYERGATNSIPGSINDKVTEQLIRESCSKWKEIVAKLLKDISRLIRDMASASVKDKLVEWQHTKLYVTMKQVLSTYVQKTMEAEGQRIYGILDCLQKKPTITNNNYETKRKQHLGRLVGERYPRQTLDDTNSPDDKWVDEKLADDSHSKVIECVATIYAYHDILSDNFAGTRSILLKAGVLAELVEKAPAALRGEMKVLDTEHCAALLAGDPDHEEQRAALLDEKEKLKHALSILENLQDAE